MTDVILGLIALAVLIWAAYSLFCVLLPLRPFPTRRSAAKSLGLMILAFMGVGVIAQSTEEKAVAVAGSAYEVPQLALEGTESGTVNETLVPSPQPVESDSAIKTELNASGDIPQPCGEGGLALRDVVAVTGEQELFSSPKLDAPRIKNEKASKALGRAHYHQIDYSTTVRRLCAQSEWTEVQIVTPDWLTSVRGWVPNSVLREIERSEDGTRKFVEADFFWDDDTSQFKPQIVAVVNRIARENRNCSTIDPSSVAKSPSRSKPNDPVFFVTCGTGTDVFNVWFKPADAEGGELFLAKTPLDRNAAADACEMAAKQAATHPSTVSFSRVWDLAYIPHPSGRARVVSSFTAKNALNLELKFRIDCLFDGSTLIETNIAESLE